MKHLNYLPLIAVIALASACVSAPDATPPANLDWVGTYAGTGTMADGAEFTVTVTLNEDSTWALTFEMPSAKVLGTEEGRIEWKNGGTVVVLTGLTVGPPAYRVDADSLVELDEAMKPVGGTRPGSPILARQPDATSAASSEGW